MVKGKMRDEGAALGVDGGAGTLKFAVRTPAGAMVFHECAGANHNLIGMNEFIGRLSQGALDALSAAGCAPESVVSAGFGLSGVDRPREISLIKSKVRLFLPNIRRTWIGNDALPALRQGAGALRGIILIAGTGSICFTVHQDGRMARVGGWGGELGDEGSGFWIGLRGLQAVCRMADGRLAKTSLLGRILDKVGVKTPEDLIEWASTRTREEFKTACAGLFPIVHEQAASGDQSAKQAVMLGIGHLVQHVTTAEAELRRMDREDMVAADTIRAREDTGGSKAGDEQPIVRVPLVCAGGLFTGDRNFYEAFVHQLRRQRDAFNVSRLAEPASLGALALGEEAPADEEI